MGDELGPYHQGLGPGVVDDVGHLGRGQPPVVGAFRRPVESAGGVHAFQGPSEIVRPVGGEAQSGARLHHPRQVGQEGGVDQPTLVMAQLGPGVGKQHEHPVDRGVWQHLQQLAPVAWMDADIVQVPDVAQRTGHPVEERLGAQEQHFRVGDRLTREVLARAKAELEPGFGRVRLQGLQVERPARQVQRDEGKQVVHQRGSPGPQAAAPDAAEAAQDVGGARAHLPTLTCPHSPAHAHLDDVGSICLSIGLPSVPSVRVWPVAVIGLRLFSVQT